MADNQITTSTNSLQKWKEQPAVNCPTPQTAIKLIEETYMRGALTLETAVKGHQLSAYRANNRPELQLVIASLLLGLSKSFALSEDKTLTVQDANSLAIYIIQEKWHLKLSQIYLFIENAKNGKYGKIYHGLSRAVIMEWILAFELETDKMLESKRAKKMSDTEQVLDGIKCIDIINKHKPEIIEDLKLIGIGSHKYVNSSDSPFHVTEKSRDEKNRITLLHNLQMYFPKEMEQIFKKVDTRFRLKGKQTTTSVLVRYKPVKELQKILSDKFTNVNKLIY